VKVRLKKFTEKPASITLLERERFGLGRYRKVRERDPEKRRILIELALEKIREAERTDYLLVGFRRRRLKG
jgi:hypothetical protein